MRVGNPGLKRRGDAARGFTLLSVLVLMAVSAIGLSAAASIWSHDRQRERERDLVRIGSLYAAALEQYRSASPGSAKQYPLQLEDLVLDKRFVGTVRHLRRLYPDPLNPGAGWLPVRDQAGYVRGVRSSSAARPIGDQAVDARGVVLARVERYDQWLFVARETP